MFVNNPAIHATRTIVDPAFLESRSVPMQDVPQWAGELVGREPTAAEQQPPDVEIAERGGLRLVSAVSPACRETSPEIFATAVRDAYRRLFDELHGYRPIRLWNFIPDVGRRISKGLDRYTNFNEARYAALLEVYGTQETLQKNLRAATALGHSSTSFAVHCLASNRPSSALENPRQIPAWRYSATYGPTPPSFARACIARLGPGTDLTLLIGGTASICGEASRHPDDVVSQTRETFTNLHSLIAAGIPGSPVPPLSRLTHLRVYRHPSIGEGRMRAAIAPHVQQPDLLVEHCTANLCRPELVVEIEGRATLEG